MSSNQVVKVRRDEIAACMTCPICNKLFRDATTISECLHTFCRKCIRKKLSQEELECCPICNIDLGCVPLEKLRPDHNLQDVRAKIFPYKRRRVKAPEFVHSITLPLRRKERSLSSLVVSTPRVSPQTTMTGKRSKVTPRKKSRGSTFSIEKPVKKEDNSMEEDCQESSSSHETSNKINHNSKQNSCSNDEKEGGEPWEGKVDWKPLNDLVEAANRSKSSKLASQGSIVKSEPSSYTTKSEGHLRKPKGKDQLQLQLQIQRAKVEDDKDGHEADVTESVKPPKKFRRNRKKKSGELGDSTGQAVVDGGVNNSVREKRSYPIWFQLVPFEQQEGEALRQIEGRYVKLNDGNVPVSIIQKLVMNKLELPSEHEVELRCMGEPVVPTVQLRNLMELWIQAHPDVITAKIGSSAQQFVMEISYAKKPQPPQTP
ncbi:hypothetical protein L2E82_00230 [Cichorium intybus]|uniref:Uncharacterized protein n=1 Tax=Cichorium intybus TaxID=13427 RepID=A0ACB9GXH3_CICIN|nr:hypothetical protein L2E82_00230 [Cichorium intybus]